MVIGIVKGTGDGTMQWGSGYMWEKKRTSQGHSEQSSEITTQKYLKAILPMHFPPAESSPPFSLESISIAAWLPP